MKNSRFFPAWLAVTALFLIWLAWIVSSVVPAVNANTLRSTPDDTNLAFVLNGLPEKDASAVPSPPFTEQGEYVLAGAGLQGFYQNSAPNTVWTLSYDAPQLAVQLVKRGPPSPQIVTEGVKVTWRLDGPVRGTAKNTMPAGEMQAVQDSHFQAAIPVNALTAENTLDPYPVATFRAKDAKTGKILAESAAVLAVSPGFACANCHADAGKAILEAHDRHSATTLQQQSAKGEVIACRSCHGKQELNVSAAMHGWHAAFLPGKDETACMACHISLGPKPLFARDFHVDKGLACVSCHGYLEDHALALLKAEQESGKPQAVKSMAAITPREADRNAIKARQPWLQQPDCASCHDFSKRPDPKTASAFNKWTEKDNGESGLFANRKDDMVMVRCITCHGAPHAAYPAKNPVAPGLDNIPPVQYQKKAAPFGAFGNCAMCHGEPKDFFAHHPLPEGK